MSDNWKKQRRIAFALILVLTFVLVTGCTSKGNENDVKFSKISDFKGRNVGILSGSYFDRLVEERIDGVKCKYYETVPELVLALKNKDIDGVVYDNPVNEYLKIQNPEFETLTEVLEKPVMA